MVEHSRIIDAHTHFGRNILHSGDSTKIQYFECPPEDYVVKAKMLGVTDVIASYAPCPEYQVGGQIERPCFWLQQNGQVLQFRETYQIDSTHIQREPAFPNPYSTANRLLLEMFHVLNSENKDIKFYSLGLHHPLLDSEESVCDLLTNKTVVGLKLHGLATHTGPEDVPLFVIKALRNTDKPIVVHTDTSRDNTPSSINTLFNRNDPLRWLQWSISNKVRIFLTHGARLCSDSMKIVSENEGKVLIGISPDVLLQAEPLRLKKNTDNYLRDLVSICPIKALTFDIDYSWNVFDRTEWDKKDWETLSRIRKMIVKREDLNRVLYQNAAEFYKI